MTSKATGAPAYRPAFVGLGNIGAPICANLAAAFPGTLVYDSAGTEDRMPPACVAASEIGHIAVEASHVFFSLPSGSPVLEVSQALADARGPALRMVIDLSTIGVEAAGEAAARLGRSGIAYIDAPVSGGAHGARARTISVMCAGDKGAFDEARPLVEAISSKIFHVGLQPGQGQALKLLNNFLSATALAATSEAVAFGVGQGLSIDLMLEVLNVSSGQSAATSDKFVNHVATGTYGSGFMNQLMAKDLGLFAEATKMASRAGPIGALVSGIWGDFAYAAPNSDFTRIYEFVADRMTPAGGVTPGPK